MEMDVLGRASSPLSAKLWEAIDAAVVNTARNAMVGRQFLSFHLLPHSQAQVLITDTPEKTEEDEEGLKYTKGRYLHEIPQLYEDWWLYWRDLQTGGSPDLSAASSAAQTLALREDTMIFYGVSPLGLDGLASVSGSNTIKKKDWSTGENAFSDIASGVALLQQHSKLGKKTLIVSPDVYSQVLRIQPGTGILESERIEKMLGGSILTTPALRPKSALLVCAQPQYMDLAVGMDVQTAYLETADLNHHLRIMETVALRIKAPKAIVKFQ